MMADTGGLTAYEDQIAALEASFSDAGAVTAAFSAELGRMQAAAEGASRETEVLSRGFSRGLRRAFDGLVFDGARASDALKMVSQSLVNTVYSAALKPVTNQLGGMLASVLSGFAAGGAFSQGRVMPFATGGVVSGPTAFPMRGGTGLMGEAGPEAIMPLTRGSDGRLGVRMEGGGRPVQVVMNISTPDAASFRRSQNQIAAEMGRALTRGQRNR